MQTFEIPEAPLSVPLTRRGSGTPDAPQAQEPHTGSIKFTVNNKASHGVSGRVSVQPQGDASNAWFTVEGEAQRQFHVSGSHVYTVRIQVPHDTPPGRHSFRLRVVNVNDPDNDFTESSVAGFEVPATAPAGGFKWWILLVVLGGLLLVAGLAFAIWKLIGPGGADTVDVPDLVGEAALCEDVREHFADRLDVVCNAAEETGGLAAGTVITQDADPGTPLESGATLTLTYDPGVVMPDLNAVDIKDAATRLTDMGFTPVLNDLGPEARNGRALNAVIGQRPAAGEPIDPDATVELDYVKGVKVGRFIGMKLDDAVRRVLEQKMDLASPTPTITNNRALDGKVTNQTPVENDIVPTGTPITLTYYKHRASSPCRVTKINGRPVLSDCLLRPQPIRAATEWRRKPQIQPGR